MKELHKYGHIVQTYLYRPRFWFSGGAYLFLVAQWTDSPMWEFAVLPSLLLSTIVCCFLALHLRRQFGGPAAQMLPDFAVPHLAVGAFMGLAICVAIPWYQAFHAGLPRLPIVAIHAVAAVVLGLVACWPRAFVLVLAAPLGMVWIWSGQGAASHAWLPVFLHGDYPTQAWSLIALAAAVQPLAAYRLLRLSDREVSVSDDFTIQELPREGAGGRWERAMLAHRDQTVERRLATGKQNLLWSVQRWRIPVSSGWAQWIATALFVWGLMALAALSDRGRLPRDHDILVLMVSCGVMLFAPYGRWHSRRAAFSFEATRPVTRRLFVRELSAALALDVASWMCLVTIIYVVGMLGASLPRVYYVNQYMFVFFISCCVLWGMAALLYGIGLVVLRFSYWLPLMFGGLIAWFATFWSIVVVLALLFEGPLLRDTVRHTPPPVGFFAFFLATALSGYFLARWAQRTWIEADFS